MRLRSIRLLSFFVSALLLPSVVAAQTVTLATGGEQVTIAIGDDARLPADFPGDVFLLPGSALWRVQQVDNRVMLLEFRTQAAPATVADRYAAAMADAGWTRARVTRIQGAFSQAWEKDQRAVVVSAGAVEGGTRLQVQLRPRQSRTSSTDPAPGP